MYPAFVGVSHQQTDDLSITDEPETGHHYVDSRIIKIRITPTYFFTMEIIEDHAYFFTATILGWKPVLETEEAKKIVIDSLSFLHHNKRAYIYAFVIMNNHIHLIWQMRGKHLRMDVQRDFLKYTAQEIKRYLKASYTALLDEMELGLSDRKYQIWQRNSLNVPLYSHKVFLQKLDYIHANPVKAGLCAKPTAYLYSSAGFYYRGDLSFDFLNHHDG